MWHRGHRRGKNGGANDHEDGFFDNRRMLLCDREWCNSGGLVWIMRHTALLLSQL